MKSAGAIMKILSIDSSAKSAGAALTDGNRLISECFVNAGLTHSKTLLVMIDNVLRQADMGFDSVEGIAVNSGPGSFTGIRIGVALAKGLAFKNNLPVCGISTLESIAYNFAHEKCVVCSCMDARVSRVYTALFRCGDGRAERITPDSAATVDDIISQLRGYSEKIYLAGDGADVYYDRFREFDNVILPPEKLRLQNAYSVSLAAANGGKFEDSSALAPVYLRLPQAERERIERLSGEADKDLTDK